MEFDVTEEGSSKGGKARAAALSKADRKAIAKKAANARWTKDLPIADYEGEFSIGDKQISSAVLTDERRIITQATFLRALGRSRSPKAGTGVLSTVDELPVFLQADVLKPFISSNLEGSTTPIFYRTKSGGKGVGYDARLLPQVAEVYLKFRDDSLQSSGKVPARYEKMIQASDILMRGLASVGIVALVDEATGYQHDRASDALAKILEEFIAKELRPWVKTFPDQYYEELFRLRGLTFPADRVKKPQYFGTLTNDIIYARLAPGVLEELKKSTPKDQRGRRRHHFHRKLTDDIGHPKLREHMAAVLTTMQLSVDYKDFKEKLDRVRPKYNETIQLPFDGKGLGL